MTLLLPKPAALRASPGRPWQPMSDAEWRVLAGFVLRHGLAGRPPRDHRARLDGVFRCATGRLRWTAAPPEHGAPGTLGRQFRRWAARGLFDALLLAARDPASPHAATLRGMEHWLCCAYRRAVPVAGTGMAELLGYASALPPRILAGGPAGASRRAAEAASRGPGRAGPAGAPAARRRCRSRGRGRGAPAAPHAGDAAVAA